MHLQLVAFVVPKLDTKKDSHLTANTLKAFLKDILPNYMIPTAYIFLHEFPLNTNGKINKKALLDEKNYSTKNLYQKSETSFQNKMISIWEKVLNISPVGISDDFFELGGDSIIAMQLISEIQKECNLFFTIENIFKHPTISALSKTCHESIASTKTETQDFFDNDIPLTPIQKWFFERKFVAPAQWSQLCLLKLKKDLDLHCLKKTINHLIQQFDSLRLKFYKKFDTWYQKIEVNKADHYIFEKVPLTEKNSYKTQLKQMAQHIQGQFDLEKGPLLGVAYFYEDKTFQPITLLIVIHHLLVDGVSWRIILAHLISIYNSYINNEEPVTIPITPFSVWAKTLSIEGTRWTNQNNYWLEAIKEYYPLPVDISSGINKEQETASFELTLDSETTRFLLGPIHHLYQTKINDILLAVLLKIFTSWTKKNTLIFHLESHGRQDIQNLNIINTTGWFTSLFPVSLTLHGESWNEILNSVKSQLSLIPMQGIGYGILRFLAEPHLEIRKSLENSKDPELCFNYWGQFENILNQNPYFEFGELSLLAGPKNQRTHLINVDCIVRNNQLHIIWTYSKKLYFSHTIKFLAENYKTCLLDLIHFCKETYKKMKIGDNNISSHLNIEEIYPLTTTQQGILYQQLRSQSDCYEIQTYSTINEILHLNSFQEAAQELIKRHTILRSSINWLDFDTPHQLVHRHVDLFWTFHDLNFLDKNLQEQEFIKLLIQDREKRIDLSVAPLLRISLVKFSNQNYRLIWRCHHIILDGWSLAILRNELEQLYCTYSTQKINNLPAAYPFSQYVNWINQQDWSAGKIFWSQYLKGYTETYEVPIMDSEGTKKPYLPQFCEIDLSNELSDCLREFTRSHKISLNIFFQGLWGILLYKYHQSNDIIFGITSSGRSIPFSEVEKRVGLFINTIPLRIKFYEGLNINDYLHELLNNFTNLLHYDNTPLTIIQECSEFKNKNISIFDTLVVFENYPDFEAKKSKHFYHDTQYWDPTHYLMNFIIEPTNSIKMKISFDENRISRSKIKSLLNHANQLLSYIIKNPWMEINKIALITIAEYKKIFAHLNKIQIIPSKTVVNYFENQVKQNSNRLAVKFNQTELSYKELNRLANQLAHHLKSLGIGPEIPVTCCLPRSSDLIIGLLGIWKAGGIYSPLDPTYPLDRIKTILNLSKSAYIITCQDIFDSLFSNNLQFTHFKYILLDTHSDIISKHSAYNSDIAYRENQSAYIIFTSGTTGVPKGILQEHKTLANLINWQNKNTAKKNDRRITQIAAMNFDVSLQEICYALCNGYELNIVPSEFKLNMTALAEFVEYHKIDQIFLPTALLNVFCEAAILANCRLDNLTDIFVSGEALRISCTIKNFFHRYFHVRLTNQYGPTETHVVTSYKLPKRISEWPECIPIGFPIDNVKLLVLDPSKQLVPPNIPGELFIGGVCLARGYLNDTQKTSENFIVYENSRYYKTGDKVKWMIDGGFEYIGRYDEQIKVNGQRIEPAEIENFLFRQAGIKECAILLRKVNSNHHELVCYLIKDLNDDNI